MSYRLLIEQLSADNVILEEQHMLSNSAIPSKPSKELSDRVQYYIHIPFKMKFKHEDLLLYFVKHYRCELFQMQVTK